MKKVKEFVRRHAKENLIYVFLNFLIVLFLLSSSFSVSLVSNNTTYNLFREATKYRNDRNVKVIYEITDSNGDSVFSNNNYDFVENYNNYNDKKSSIINLFLVNYGDKLYNASDIYSKNGFPLRNVNNINLMNPINYENFVTNDNLVIVDYNFLKAEGFIELENHLTALEKKITIEGKEYIIFGVFDGNLFSGALSAFNGVYGKLNVPFLFGGNFLFERREVHKSYMLLGPDLKTNYDTYKMINKKFNVRANFDVEFNDTYIKNYVETFTKFIRSKLVITGSLLFLFTAFLFGVVVTVFGKNNKKIEKKITMNLFVLSYLVVSLVVLWLLVERRILIQQIGLYLVTPTFITSFLISFLLTSAFLFLLRYYNNRKENIVMKSTRALPNTTSVSPANKIVLMIGNISIPNNSAGALRCENVAEMFNLLDYEVFISGISIDDEYTSSTKGDINYLNHSKTSKRTLLGKISYILSKKNRVKKIINEFQQRYNKTIGIVYIYSSLEISVIKYILKTSKERGFKVIFDVVERQVLGQQTFSSFFSYYLSNKYIFTNIGKQKDIGIISISEYLFQHFKSFNNASAHNLYLPFVIKTNDDHLLSAPTEIGKTVFVYAGMAHKNRDSLINMIKGFNIIADQYANKFEFWILGTSISQIVKDGLNLTELQKSTEYAKYYGRVSHDKVKEFYSKCNFTVLLKPNLVFSKAGFPTKIAESWSFGIPVVANKSSDLDNFMVDRFNSIVVQDDSPNSFADAISKALLLSEKELEEMRENSLSTIKSKLDISNYLQNFNEFVESLDRNGL